ncbi:MAG: hypothetical protein U1E28_22145 [Beijerinckiaceae bacterium]
MNAIAARAALEGARPARTAYPAARAAIEEAVRLAPDDIDVRMGAYKFYFYAHEYEQAARHAGLCIDAFAADLGLSPAWRDVRACDAEFGAIDQKCGRYLQALIAWGYCRARSGALYEGRAAVEKAADLDPTDRFGARRLIAVIDRGGEEVDDYAA